MINTIFLFGYMGAGKTVIGKSLSRSINYEFYDLDNFIEEESKKYKDASQFKQWIENQPQQIEQFRMIVLEQKLVDNLKNDLKSKDKVIEFSELANK